MRNKLAFLTYLVCFMVSVSCATVRVPSATPNGPRTIVADGKMISEKEPGLFRCWVCKDFLNGEAVLVEVGFFDDPKLEGLGFILYDGGYSGDLTLYHREGLEHRWDWGPNSTDYSFVIRLDGTGLYYDFSTMQKGEKTKPSDLYKCHQR